jgi:hypothetical protein
MTILSLPITARALAFPRRGRRPKVAVLGDRIGKNPQEDAEETHGSLDCLRMNPRMAHFRPFSPMNARDSMNPREPAVPPILKVEHEPLGILDRFLDVDEEGDGLFAVDQAVVIGEGKIHHRPGHDLAVAHDWVLLDTVHAENP